jgi:4-amino-4-deoxy-L-arabinose transferase-like glycosyltransferase
MRWGAALLIGLLALGWRLHGLDAVPWYPDEADTAELALCYAQGQAPVAGAIKQSAFFPLSASPMAPLAAVPALRALGGGALPALRRWSALLSAAACALLAWLLWAWVGPWAALAAGSGLALSPLARDLGQMGFYHHLGALLSLTALAAWWRYQRAPDAQGLALLGLACGLSVAAAYWLLWLLLLPLAAALMARRPRDLVWALPGLLLPLAAVALWSWHADPAGFWGDLHDLLTLTQDQLPEPLRRYRAFIGFYQAARADPGLAMALLGLLGWAWQDRAKGAGSAAWAAGLWALASSGEIFRQRQNLEGFPYPLILVLPAMGLGLGVAAQGLATWGWRGRPTFKLLAALGLAAGVWAVGREPDLGLMRLASAPVADTQALLAALPSLAKPGDRVLGQPSFNWALRQKGLVASDLEQASAYIGERGAFMRGDLLHDRFTAPLGLEGVKWLVISPYTYGIQCMQPGPRRLLLQAEMGGWGKAWGNATYTVYGNPALGAPLSPVTAALLGYYNVYDQAAVDAMARQDWAAARWALMRVRDHPEGDRAGRLRALAQVEAALRRAKHG